MCPTEHTEIYLLGIKAQDKAKMKLPLDMVNNHEFLYLFFPDYFHDSSFSS